MEKMIVTIFNTEAAAYDGVSALKALNDGGDITFCMRPQYSPRMPTGK